MQGRLVVLEGTDASGKANQSKLLVKNLRKHGYNAVRVSFPRYKSFFGRIVAMYLQGKFGGKEKMPAELSALLYSLDRFDFKPELEKLLGKGKIVVCDRYTASNLAYQTAKIKNKKEQGSFLRWLGGVESRLPVPAIKIFLDMPVQAAQKLIKKRYGKKGKMDLHESDTAYLEIVRKIYLSMVRKEKDWLRVRCVKRQRASIAIKSRAEIQESIWSCVKTRL